MNPITWLCGKDLYKTLQQNKISDQKSTSKIYIPNTLPWTMHIFIEKGERKTTKTCCIYNACAINTS